MTSHSGEAGRSRIARLNSSKFAAPSNALLKLARSSPEKSIPGSARGGGLGPDEETSIEEPRDRGSRLGAGRVVAATRVDEAEVRAATLICWVVGTSG